MLLLLNLDQFTSMKVPSECVLHTRGEVQCHHGSNISVQVRETGQGCSAPASLSYSLHQPVIADWPWDSGCSRCYYLAESI